MINKINDCIKLFNATTHGTSSYDQDPIYIRSSESSDFLPLTYLQKVEQEQKNAPPDSFSATALQSQGYCYSSADFLEDDHFSEWYRKQFGKRLTTKLARHIGILSLAHTEAVKGLVVKLGHLYQDLRKERIINNGKNLPVQLAEWYAKVIFGLRQMKSTSQRGFDFYNPAQKRVEVMVDWNERTSPKGAKLKKSLVELSDYCLVMYINHQFLVREMLYLDSTFLLRKFSTKGHTIFLKDTQVQDYYFTSSSHHHDKIVAKDFLLQFSSTTFQQKLQSFK